MSPLTPKSQPSSLGFMGSPRVSGWVPLTVILIQSTNMLQVKIAGVTVQYVKRPCLILAPPLTVVAIAVSV